MVTVPNYAMDSKNYVQGPGRVFFAPYVSGGADPDTGNIVAIGLFGKDGISFEPKKTYQDRDSDQFTWPVETFLTKQEGDIKINMEEMSASNLTIGIGQKSDSLAPGPPAVISLGEFFNIISASGVPNTRPEYRHWIIQFPAPGYDNSTTPKGKYATLQIYKGAVIANGGLKVGKEHGASLMVTIRPFMDTTVSDPTLGIGKITLP